MTLVTPLPEVQSPVMTNIAALDLIRAHRWSRLFFTTYALSLSFFEAVVLDAIIRQDIGHAVVLADVAGVRAAMEEYGAVARRGRFQVVLVWASDRIARSVRHFLEVLDEFNRLNVEFVSFRENLDTGGPLGRAVGIIIGAIAELERNLIIERVRAGMRRARLEGRHIGRRPLEVDRVAVLRDRNRGDSLTNIAKTHRVSRATVSRLLKQAKDAEPLSI